MNINFSITPQTVDELALSEMRLCFDLLSVLKTTDTEFYNILSGDCYHLSRRDKPHIC